jgi:N-carbamoyl-L-amino-acid hydrolase
VTTGPAPFVDAARLWSRHEQMARHGATPAGGVNRPALSREEIEARRLLIDWGTALSLTAATDPAGNLFLRMEGREPDADPVMTGSHLDSQPTGGRFDGVYGVLAGLEAVHAMRDAGLAPRRPIEIVAWMNEEGSRFAPGMMGSSAFCAARTLASILPITDVHGISVQEALSTMREAFAALPLKPLGRPVHAYVEAHIEQGPILERERCSVGVVTGIQGKRTFAVAVSGEEAHAGTARRQERKDALLASVRAIEALARLCHDDDDLVKFTVGRLDVKPNAPSVVPGLVRFSIDLRHPDSAVLLSLGDRIAEVCAAHAQPCSVEVTELSTALSIQFPTSMRELIHASAVALAIPCIDILSSAGHDARYLHDICPSGMIFVPCKDGISHNEAESATAEDLATGTRVLAETLWRLAA